jgi:hypothetical protein
MNALKTYVKVTAALSAGGVAMHSHQQRKRRIPVTLATELICIPRDLMIGAFLGPFLIGFSAFTDHCPFTPPPSLK